MQFHQSRTTIFVGAAALGLLAALIAAVPADAQRRGRGMGADPDRVAEGGGEFPAGWSARPDRGSADQIVFNETGGAYNFTMGPNSTFYNSNWTKSGDYDFSARLTQLAAPSHPISYGLMIGGSNLEGEDQTYTYFLVRNRGEYFIANREGGERPVLVDWTAHDAINAEGDDGRQTNVLGIRVEGDQVHFMVNGTEVTSLAKSQVHADGLNGFRIGHNLDVEIDQVMQ